MAFVGDKLQRIDRDRLLGFLDELTMLARRYNMVITGEEFSDMPSVKFAPFEDVHQGRYEVFSEGAYGDLCEHPVIEGPVEIVFVPQGELENLVDLTKI
jgi:hypothetical protein